MRRMKNAFQVHDQPKDAQITVTQKKESRKPSVFKADNRKCLSLLPDEWSKLLQFYNWLIFVTWIISVVNQEKTNYKTVVRIIIIIQFCHTYELIQKIDDEYTFASKVGKLGYALLLY